MKKNGFTLVEIIVVMAITAMVGTILVIIFINTLRGSNKAQILSVIKQNGQIVLENMDKTIRNADDVVCRSTDGNTLVVVNNGIYTRFRLVPPTLTANGSIQQDFPVQPSEKYMEVFLRDICYGTDPLIAAQYLTHSSLQTGVSVRNVSLSEPLFTRNQQDGLKDSITISFLLAPAIGSPTVVVSQIDPVSFQTTIGLR